MALSPLPENVLPAGADTVLTISGLGGFQYQARGLAQSLGIIPQAKQQARTINANLRDISNHAFRKYTTEITCSDINAPPLDGLFPGDIVTVHCAAVLCYATGNLGSPHRSEVSGSGWTLGHMNFYRPILEIMITDVTENFEEWKSDFQWKIAGEEV
jgi:hypothetical protein